MQEKSKDDDNVIKNGRNENGFYDDTDRLNMGSIENGHRNYCQEDTVRKKLDPNSEMNGISKDNATRNNVAGKDHKWSVCHESISEKSEVVCLEEDKGTCDEKLENCSNSLGSFHGYDMNGFETTEDVTNSVDQCSGKKGDSVLAAGDVNNAVWNETALSKISDMKETTGNHSAADREDPNESQEQAAEVLSLHSCTNNSDEGRLRDENSHELTPNESLNLINGSVKHEEKLSSQEGLKAGVEKSFGNCESTLLNVRTEVEIDSNKSFMNEKPPLDADKNAGEDDHMKLREADNGSLSDDSHANEEEINEEEMMSFSLDGLAGLYFRLVI